MNNSAIAKDIEAVEVQDIINLMNERAKTYGFLSRMYAKEIDEKLLDGMHESLYPVTSGNADIDEGNRLLAQYLSNVWENTITELAADYMRVFYGHGYSGRAAAYPFESVYVSEKRLMMQSARDEVLALYRSAGLDKRASWKEGEDHIALELEYLYVLCLKTAEALTAGRSDEALALITSQYNFLKDHLILWAPLMANEIKHFSKTEFYQSVAFLTDGFLNTDIDLLEDLIRENNPQD